MEHPTRARPLGGRAMALILRTHAPERMVEYGLALEWIAQTVAAPDWTHPAPTGLVLRAAIAASPS